MARTSVINGIALEALQNDRLKERTIIPDLLNTQMKRGRNEYHVTSWTKRNEQGYSKTIKDRSDSFESEYQEPVPGGIGRTTDEDGQEVFYVVLDWEWGDKVRHLWDLLKREIFI